MNKLLTIGLAALALFGSAQASAQQRGKVLFVVTNVESMPDGTPSGIHFNELTHPYYAFTDSGYAVDFASIEGGNGPVDPATLDQADPLNRRFWNDPGLRARLSRTARIDGVNASEYEAVFLVGGVTTMWDFPNSPALQKLIGELFEAGRVVGGVCHGPAALVNVRLSDGRYLVDGKDVSSFTDEEETARSRQGVVPFLLETRLKELGAKFTKAAPFRYHVVSDGLLVTGQNPASAFGVAHEMIRVMREAQ